MIKGTLANVVAVVEHLGTSAHELHHQAHMRFHASHRKFLVLGGVCGSQ